MPKRTIDEIRRATAQERWSDAEALLEHLCGEIEIAWSRAASDEERRSIAKDVQETLDWARAAARTSRDHDQRKLMQGMSSRAYACVDDYRDTVRFEA